MFCVVLKILLLSILRFQELEGGVPQQPATDAQKHQSDQGLHKAGLFSSSNSPVVNSVLLTTLAVSHSTPRAHAPAASESVSPLTDDSVTALIPHTSSATASLPPISSPKPSGNTRGSLRKNSPAKGQRIKDGSRTDEPIINSSRSNGKQETAQIKEPNTMLRNSSSTATVTKGLLDKMVTAATGQVKDDKKLPPADDYYDDYNYTMGYGYDDDDDEDDDGGYYQDYDYSYDYTGDYDYLDGEDNNSADGNVTNQDILSAYKDKFSKQDVHSGFISDDASWMTHMEGGSIPEGLKSHSFFQQNSIGLTVLYIWLALTLFFILVAYVVFKKKEQLGQFIARRRHKLRSRRSISDEDHQLLQNPFAPSTSTTPT